CMRTMRGITMKLTNRMLAAAACAIAASAFASTANATVYTLDTSASSINFYKELDLCLGCGLSGLFTSDADDFEWTAASPTDWTEVDDFIEWTVGDGIGGELYSVEVELK